MATNHENGLGVKAWSNRYGTTLWDRSLQW